MKSRIIKCDKANGTIQINITLSHITSLFTTESPLKKQRWQEKTIGEARNDEEAELLHQQRLVFVDILNNHLSLQRHYGLLPVPSPWQADLRKKNFI